jgi:hypothetical protein
MGASFAERATSWTGADRFTLIGAKIRYWDRS